MPKAGFEFTIPVSEQPQTHALDLAATGIGTFRNYNGQFFIRKTGKYHYTVDSTNLGDLF
jgi:VCBS repeat-containing protein